MELHSLLCDHYEAFVLNFDKMFQGGDTGVPCNVCEKYHKFRMAHLFSLHYLAKPMSDMSIIKQCGKSCTCTCCDFNKQHKRVALNLYKRDLVLFDIVAKDCTCPMYCSVPYCGQRLLLHPVSTHCFFFLVTCCRRNSILE